MPATGQVPLLRTIEGLRLVASIGIAALHILPHAGVRPPGTLSLFVDLFFVVSGIVIGGVYVGVIRSAEDYGRFLRKRFARLYPLHLATLLFYIAIGVGVARYHLTVDDPSRFDAGQIVPNLLLIHAWFPDGKLSYNFVSWSISAEVFAYLVFPVLAAAIAIGRGRGLLMVAVLLAASIWLARALTGLPLYELTWRMGILRVLPSFAFGLWLAVHGAGVLRPLLARSGAVFHAALAVFAIALFAPTPGYLMLAASWGLVAAGLLADQAGVSTLLSVRPISAQGRLTYSIYMLHVPVTTVFISFVFPRLLGRSPAAAAVSIGLGVVIIALLSAASFAWFENPLRRWIGGGAAARPRPGPRSPVPSAGA
ncbi:acyltransferase family protein [Sphingomonas bacterium]|uniref:acyltransferase family protein n=1 Tax=Sphingomonas bacterium TaxID=1895847 RepID=UPI00157652CC|nr:acyltransferase [Sphingomonas bacterium]